MKKRLVMVGMIILFLLIGLNGCIDTNHNVYDLRYNPNDYLGKEIVVSARYFALDNSIFDELNAFGRIPLIIPDGVNNSMLVQGGHYFFKGSLEKHGTLPYFRVSEIFTSDPSYNFFSVSTDNPCCLAIGVVIVILLLIGFFWYKKGKEKKYEVEEKKHFQIEENFDVKEYALQYEKQKSYDELKKLDLVFMIKYEDFLGILKELKQGEVVKALTMASKPPNAKVFITNKRIIMRKYPSAGTELGVDLDINYSDIEKESISIGGIIGKVHFKTKGQLIMLDAPVSKYIIRDIINELVENTEKK